MTSYKQDQMFEVYFETLWEKHKPSQKLPVDFENKLKESMFKMISEVWRTSAMHEKETIKRNFSDFVDGKLYTCGPIA